MIVDPTGVGDAFRGGFLAGYSRGFDWKLCGEIGSLAAVYCLEQKGPQSHTYSKVGIYRIALENILMMMATWMH